MKYSLVVCGGTFDHFHKGHKEFLNYTLSLGNTVLIGLTTDKFVTSKNNDEWVEDYKLRKQQIEEFLDQEKAIKRVQIHPIDDIFIPKTWKDLPIEAIVVSKNTIWGAEKINAERIEQKKTPLRVELCSLVKSKHNGYISSSRVRNGEINREGIPYVNPMWLNNRLIVTEELRSVLKKPFGVLFLAPQDVKISKCPYLATVGDITAKTFNELNLHQNLSVVDFKVSRKKKFSNLDELGFSSKVKVVHAENPAGCITPSLFSAVNSIFSIYKNEKVVLEIEGEEDLAVLPLILVAPLKSVIFYGQPGQGLVRVDVSEKSKERAYGLVGQCLLEVIDK